MTGKKNFGYEKHLEAARLTKRLNADMNQLLLLVSKHYGLTSKETAQLTRMKKSIGAFRAMMDGNIFIEEQGRSIKEQQVYYSTLSDIDGAEENDC